MSAARPTNAGGWWHECMTAGLAGELLHFENIGADAVRLHP